MSGAPRFDELFGDEAAGPERERLQRVHELLVQAGPPPELPPHLESGPSSTVLRFRRPTGRRVAFLLAAAIAAGAVFAAGYGIGHHGGSAPSSHAAWTVGLRGTAAAPTARATLEILPGNSGNWPMKLHVTGLPSPAQYDVYLVRNGKPWASCGTFAVAGDTTLSVTLNAPYPLRYGDKWVVTRETPGSSQPGPTVLRPA
jgi:hypothetical protein